MLEEWISKTKSLYDDFNVLLNEDKRGYKAEELIKDWVTER